MSFGRTVDVVEGCRSDTFRMFRIDIGAENVDDVILGTEYIDDATVSSVSYWYKQHVSMK